MKKHVLALGLVTIFGLSMSVQASELSNGWCKTNDSWIYVENGTKVKNQWELIVGNWYYFNEDGKMQTGWQEIAGHWYYLLDNGVCLGNCWQDGYYLDDCGRWVQIGWIKYQDDWYYISDGQFLTNTWIGDYYLSDNGKMAVSRWVDNYYVDANGKYVCNCFIGDWYLGSDGKLAFNQWVQQEGQWYYIGNNGKLVCDECIQKGSTKYRFNRSGKMIASKQIDSYATIGNVSCPIKETTAYKYTAENYLYKYLPIPNYYAAERLSLVGQAVHKLSVDDTIVINDKTYRVKERKTGITYYDNEKFLQYLASGHYDIALQTCDDEATYIVIYKLDLIDF